MTRDKQLSEMLAEKMANEYLDKHIGDIFLSSEIEKLLSKYAYILYQIVDDKAYYGMSLTYGEYQFIAINTAQPVRSRYYSAAHEMWHLLVSLGEIEAKDLWIDHERAADKFAAVLMLPQKLMYRFFEGENETIEQKVIRIADLSSMPYVAVVRRIEELDLLKSVKLTKSKKKRVLAYTEDEWVDLRERIDYPSILDEERRFEKYLYFEELVDDRLRKEELSFEVAAGLVKSFAPKKAVEYMEENRNMILQMVSEDDED